MYHLLSGRLRFSPPTVVLCYGTPVLLCTLCVTHRIYRGKHRLKLRVYSLISFDSTTSLIRLKILSILEMSEQINLRILLYYDWKDRDVLIAMCEAASGDEW